MDRSQHQLGVNKIGKNIKKSPLHQQNNRLQKIRPAANVPPPVMAQPTHNLARPPMHPLPHGSQSMVGHGDQFWSAECPVSLYSHHSPRFNGSSRDTPILPSPRFNGPPQRPQQLHSNSLPSPRFNGRGILPSPTSQYLLQSPTANRNLLSTRSPYPLLSPRSFTVSSMDQPGILGPGTFPQPPASPDLVSPSSPSGILPISSPNWRGY
ncbi:protein HAIKU1 [Eutrema salsugineum]|nr:protein HAIKU1 [Eutrema salsugineum]